MAETVWDVLVVGGGPAGLAGAAAAAEAGLRVVLVDDNLGLGGQIWRSGVAGNPHGPAARWAARLAAGGVVVLAATRIVAAPEPGVLWAERGGAAEDAPLALRYRRLLIATGARERFVPFPGWTLPNVLGAGGLQALVKAGLPIAGKRAVIAGSGPLLVAVAAYLRAHGAVVPLVAEQASWPALAGLTAALARQPGKWAQALALRRAMGGVSFAANAWPTAAEGEGRLEAIALVRHGRPERIACDYLACGFHLVPNVELALLVGCEVANGCVRVDEAQRTSVPDIFCAGEPLGIGGVEAALAEGQLAGLAAAGRPAPAALVRARRRARRFAAALERAFALRAELRSLARPDTLVCRCEDVAFGRLAACTDWRQAKLHTRCGMGPCQGRICGPAASFLFGWRDDSPRPPLFPCSVATLANTD